MTVLPTWRKSSRSQASDSCVQVRADLLAIGDTKNPGESITGDVRALVRSIREGRVS
jgi:Domain of unknown function (DUF397)